MAMYNANTIMVDLKIYLSVTNKKKYKEVILNDGKMRTHFTAKGKYI